MIPLDTLLTGVAVVIGLWIIGLYFLSTRKYHATVKAETRDIRKWG